MYVNATYNENTRNSTQTGAIYYAPETTPPYFTTIPANASLFYANQSLSADFDADDAVEFGYFSINDTNFSIDQSGVLTNATSMAVGNYSINVTINDTAGNINWTRYTVQINKSNYFDCGVYFNATSPITYPNKFIVYTNCSSAYTLYKNGSSTNNASVINEAGYYNLTVQRTDTFNYTNTVMTQFFTMNKDTTDRCQIFFNTTSPINFPETFLVWANCTTPFTLYRNGTIIENNTEQLLAANSYNFSFLRTDTVNYSYIYNDSFFEVQGEADTTPPYFITIPANASLFYENESLNVDFDAGDDISFDTYSANDTRFSINSTGGLINATPLGIGNYEINVTIYDTAGNINWTRYKVQVNKSTSFNCGVYFNATSPITYPDNFIVYTNCSSDYTLYRNGTNINNASVINGGATAYNLSVQRTDTENYTNTFHQQQFIININTADRCQIFFNETSPLAYPKT